MASGTMKLPVCVKLYTCPFAHLTLSQKTFAGKRTLQVHPVTARDTARIFAGGGCVVLWRDAVHHAHGSVPLQSARGPATVAKREAACHDAGESGAAR